ncbi:hypothetical protein pb186bvf_003939 [Paramecium bursaria]
MINIMNSQNVEKAKKIIVPSLLALGGVWISYVGYIVVPLLYGYFKFARYRPTSQMLEKAWEGFVYDPEINTIQQVHQVFKRSSSLYKDIMPQFSQQLKKQRQSNKLEELKEFIQSVREEIDLKIGQSRMCIMHFLQYKNYSFEQFFQRNFEQQQDVQIIQLILDNDILLFICYDFYKHKLPTINQCVENLKQIIPLLKEKKPQFDRLRHMVVQSGLERFKFLFCITYLSDLLEPILKIQYQTLVAALRLLDFNKFQPNQKIEAEKLMNEYKQIVSELIE